MTDRDDRLFAQFRRTRAPAPLAELFDRTAPDLLRIALHLTGRTADAEDALQATFVTAIERADTWDAERGLFPWLVGILVREAGRYRRERARAPDPTRLPQRSDENPLAAAERQELGDAVMSALAQLGELYRPVVHLHLRGLDGKEIAEVLGRPHDRVRQQIARGLQQLRQLLPSGFAVATAIAVGTGRGLAAVRSWVMLHAGAVGAGAATAGAAAGTASIAAVILKWTGGATVLLAGLCAWWLSRADAAPARGTLVATTGAATAAALPEPQQPTSSPVAAPADPGAPPREEVVTLQLVAAEDRAPVAGAVLTWDGGSTTTTTSGSATIPASAAKLRYQHRDHGSGSLRVHDVASPYLVPRIAHVRVTIASNELTVRWLRANVARSDFEERLRVASEQSPAQVQQVFKDGQRIRPDVVERAPVRDGAPAELVLPYGTCSFTDVDGVAALEPAIVRIDRPDFAVTLRAAARRDDSIRGIVLDQNGAPAVGVPLSFPGPSMPRSPPRVVTCSGKDGAFAIPAKETQRFASYLLLDAAADGIGFAPELRVGPFARGTSSNVIHVRRRGLSWLRISSGDGTAPAVWSATWHFGENLQAQVDPVALVVQPDGRALLPQTMSARDWLRIEFAGEAAQLFRIADLSRRDDGIGDEVLTAALRIAAQRRVRVLDPDGRPVVGTGVHIVLAAGTFPPGEALRGELWTKGWRPGLFGFAVMPVEELHRTATDGDGVATVRAWDSPQTFVRVDAPEGLLPAAIAVADLGEAIVLQRAAHLYGEVVGVADGNDPLGGVTLSLKRTTSDGGSDSPSARVKDGRFDFGIVAADRYELAIVDNRDHSKGRYWLWSLGTIDLTGSMRRDVDFTKCRRTHAAVTVRGLEAHPEARITVGGAQNLQPDAAGRVAVELTPGRYVVEARVQDRSGHDVVLRGDGEFECREDTANEWVAEFSTEGGTLRFVDGHGEPLRRRWFAIPGTVQSFSTDDDGCIAFDMFPARRFAMREMVMRSLDAGVWKQQGPLLAVEPALSTTVAVPDAALTPPR